MDHFYFLVLSGYKKDVTITIKVWETSYIYLFIYLLFLCSDLKILFQSL